MADPNIRPFDGEAIAAAAALIAAGQIVAVPTETVYGLAADATDAEAVARIYAAKGRPSFNPLIVHVPDIAAAEAIATFDEPARALARRFWPGPLTLVLPLKHDAGVASLVTAGRDTIALRVPRHRAMQALLAATGKPLAAPSANASNGVSPTRAEHVARSLGARVPLIIDDGATQAGLESTIVRDGAVLRPGPITAEELGIAGAGRIVAAADGVSAPGQLASHYSPGKPMRLQVTQKRDGEFLIGFGPVAGDLNLSPAGDPVQAAARLFDALHAADAAPELAIAVAPIPALGIGVAINDRLTRAAHR